MRTLFERVLDKLKEHYPEVMNSEHINNAKYMIDEGLAEEFLTKGENKPKLKTVKVSK